MNISYCCIIFLIYDTFCNYIIPVYIIVYLIGNVAAPSAPWGTALVKTRAPVLVGRKGEWKSRRRSLNSTGILLCHLQSSLLRMMLMWRYEIVIYQFGLSKCFISIFSTLSYKHTFSLHQKPRGLTLDINMHLSIYTNNGHTIDIIITLHILI